MTRRGNCAVCKEKLVEEKNGHPTCEKCLLEDEGES
jgi:hypothetical protein